MAKFTVQVFREGKTYVAHNPELGVASCARTVDKAKANLRDAMTGFLKSAAAHGTLAPILEAAGYTYAKRKREWVSPDLLLTDRLSVPV